MRKKSSAWDNYAQYTCMQQRVNPRQWITNDKISLNSFIITLLIGVIGSLGIWCLSTTSRAIASGVIIEPSKYIPLAICGIFVIVGISGIYLWVKKIFS